MKTTRHIFFALPGLAAPASAQNARPDRPLRVMMSFPGGSTSDIDARAVAAHFRHVLGQPVMVDNCAIGVVSP